MTKNQIVPNHEPDELSDDELASVSGGGKITDFLDATLDATKDFFTDIYEAGKELFSDKD